MANVDLIHAHPLAVLNTRTRLTGLSFRQTLEDEYEHVNYKVYRVHTLLLDRSSQTSEVFDGFGTSIKAARNASAMSALSSHLITSRMKELQEKSQARLSVHENDIRSRLQLDAANFTSKDPVEDLLVIAKLLKVPLKKVVCPSELQPGSTNKCVGPISRGFAFGGCHFIGHAKDYNSAEQAASLSILTALRSAILETNATDFDSKELPDCSFIGGPLPIGSFVWRLHLLCRLHGATPKFTVEEKKDGEGSVRYVCMCSLHPLDSAKAHARTLVSAKEMVARLMFDRLKALPSRLSEVANSPLPYQSPANASNPIKSKADTMEDLSRPGNQFVLTRISASYGGSLHPVSRLEMIQASEKKSPPSYHLWPVDEQLTPAENTHKKPALTNKTRLLRCSCTVNDITVFGAVSRSAKFAKLSAAEAALHHLGFLVHPLPKLMPMSILKSAVADSEKETQAASEERRSHHSDPKHRVAFSYNKEVRLYDFPLNPRGRDQPQFRPSRSVDVASLGVQNVLFQPKPRCNSLPAVKVPVTSSLGRKARSKSPHRPTNSPRVLLRRTRSSSSANLSTLHRPRPENTTLNPPDEDPTVAETVAAVKALPYVHRRRRRRKRRALTLQVDPCVPKDGTADSEDMKARQNLHCSTIVGPMEDFSWRLLSQLSRVCYSEHADHSPAIASTNGKTSFTADQQLINLCERLRIPCQFTQLPRAEDCLLTAVSPENGRHRPPRTHVAHVRFLLQLGSNHISSLPNYAATASCTSVSPATTCACSALHKQQQGGCFLGQGVTGSAARHQAALKALKCLAQVVC